jgi:hypothetical protein
LITFYELKKLCNSKDLSNKKLIIRKGDTILEVSKLSHVSHSLYKIELSGYIDNQKLIFYVNHNMHISGDETIINYQIIDIKE